MKSFKNSYVIITGAGSGIGLELVRLIYPEARNILAVDISDSLLEKLQKEFLEIHVLKADLSSKEGNQHILNWVKSNWKSVDFCFANAGKAEYKPFTEQDWENMETLFQLNVHSPIQLGLSLKSLSQNSGFQHIITCSAISFWAIPGYSLYGATKAALLQWARAVWAEKEGNWLTLVFPIGTKTGFFEAAGKGTPKSFPLQSAQKVAQAIVKGVISGKKKIFPSTLFRVLLHLNNFIYVIRPFYQYLEYQKFKKWISKQS
ncbi:short-subunit dehydrogenase [Algoriphagus boseongensis]|uniref:Short-subunit dehydrogenase n=1 Tax=Algoriphagus boseongensis TaxID=1442587 RepID=A0A4V3D1V2_9BACT|nr:SDR family NAD(P)-dependent oxidoreductase [Algoriphagus boseongensis]TDQ14682.1 short-subunit dehydrogenase [Algoriphagus boseongensis]